MFVNSINKEPISISLVGDRYLLFDVDAVSHLRRVHHVCGTPIGTLPQIPQQNLFLGLPIEMMKEEVKLLVERGAAFIINDALLHEQRFGIYQDEDRKRYLEYLKIQGLEVCQIVQSAQRKRTENALAKIPIPQVKKNTLLNKNDCPDIQIYNRVENSNSIDFLDPVSDRKNFGGKSVMKSTDPYSITPTTSYISPSSQYPSQDISPVVTPSYALYKYLHDRNYFILPGLRFGCDFNVYPGDPLRFHSHFIAVSYKWDQNIPVFDIIGGGRLGTAVKKGFLIGGHDSNSEQVRTFVIEWGGM